MSNHSKMLKKTWFGFVVFGLVGMGALACSGPRKIKKIEIRPGPKEIFPMDRKGKTQQFTVAAMDKNGLFIRNVDANWSSSDPSVVSVDMTGQVSSVGSGQAEIIAKYKDLTAKATIKVRIVDKIELDPAGEQKIKMGQTIQYKAVVKNDRGQALPDARLSWSMQGYAADVDQSGLLRGQAVGDAVLTVKSGVKTARVKIVVTDR